MPYNYNRILSRAFRQFFTLFILAFAFLMPATGAFAEDVTLAWDANPEPDVLGYRLYYGTSSGAYTTAIDVGNVTEATVAGLPEGASYFFVVTAYNEGGESPPSNEASFSAIPATFATGRFAGLISGDAANAMHGYFTMKVTSSGTASGRVILNDVVCAWRGTFDATGRLVVAIFPGNGLPNFTLTLQFDPDLLAVTGSLAGEGFAATLTAKRATFVAGTNETPLSGRYTVAFMPNSGAPEQPQGYGYATLNISKVGRVKIAGRLADGSKFSSGLLLTTPDRLAIHTVVPRGGFISGELLFRDVPNVSDADATLTWSKAARPTSMRFPAAQQFTVPMIAARYQQATSPAPILEGLRGSAAHALISFCEGNLAGPGILNCPITMWAANPVVVPPPNSDRMSIRINPATGLVAGTFVLPDTTISRPFSGVLLQKGTGRGYGLFMGATQSGRVDLVPAG